MRILVIEDCKPTQIAVAGLLKQLVGPDADCVVTGRLDHGINLAATQTFDVCVLDLTLDDSHTPEITVRRFADTMQSLPTVILTATADDQLAMHALDAGAQEYVTKDNLSRLPSAVTCAVHRFVPIRQLLGHIDELLALQDRTSYVCREGARCAGGR